MMMNPPFRADQVGSLLRPERLKLAREQFLGPQTPTSAIGPHDSAELRAVEDECIREVIAMQERVGLRACTDGEFRRRSWWLELIMGWNGFEADRTGSAKLKWRDESGVTQGFSELRVTGKIGAYKDQDAFWSDLVGAYRQELKALVDSGARYIQLDDTSIAFICDPAHREYVRSWGEDPDRLLHLYADKINQTLAGLPQDVTVTLHQCRGNREGNWAAEGGYDPVADVLFNVVNVDGYFLEYDTHRAGGFEPLRLLPKGKKRVVLGLVSSKKPELEGEDILMKRIEAASKFAPLAQLALSPQCGFASSVKGNPLRPADQEAKLARIVEISQKVWGGA